MDKTTFLRWGIWTPVVALPLAMGGLVGCDDDLGDDDHYRIPDFLAGNALEVLQKDGDYATFLRGIHLIGYDDVVDSQILTVLAPTDEAFAAFLAKHGYASIDEMYMADPTFTTQVITYHLLYYAMDWDKMTNFRPVEGDAATESQRAVMAGMYNRYRTRCALGETVEWDSDPAVRDSVRVVHYDRYLTVFSEQLFRTLGIDAESNYKYFFPDSRWNPNGLANGFNVMNAAVLDTAAVVTDNGYLYHLDQVIEPCGTIYEELTQQPNYQLVRRLFDQYGYYVLDNDESSNRGHQVYRHGFNGLPDIAIEWPVADHLSFRNNSYSSWNLFLPTDQAMQRMFTEYWEEGCGYTSVEDLNPLIQEILLRENVGNVEIAGTSGVNYMCYPDFIRQGLATTTFGSVVDTDPADFDANILCNNGVIYGSNRMDVPGVFASVAGPAFKDVRYLPFLYVLDGADQLLSLSSTESDFITLIPDTAQFVHSEPAMRLYSSVASGKAEYALQQWNDELADYVTMSTSVRRDIAGMHISTDASELRPTGTQVIETNISFNYWYVRDGKITTNALFNEQLNPTFHDEIWYPFHEIHRTADGGAWSNGHAYAYGYPGVYTPATGTSLETELAQNNDRSYPYYCFSQLLRLAGLASSGKFADMLTLDPQSPRFFAFIPTNDAIKANLNAIPGCAKTTIDANYKLSTTVSDKTVLAKYLLSYFVTADRNAFTSYPYVGSTCRGRFETAGDYGIDIADDGSALSVSAASQAGSTAEGTPVAVVSTYGYLPFAFSDGAFQLIDGILK